LSGIYSAGVQAVSTYNASSFTVTSPIASSSTTTGSLIVLGGAGVAGDINAGGRVSCGGGYAADSSGTTSLTAVLTRQVLATFPLAIYRVAEYIISATQGTSYHTINVKVMHDGTNTYKTSYAEMFTTKLFTIDSNINGVNLEIGITLLAATATVAKYAVTYVGV
jgi:hypothetical protein